MTTVTTAAREGREYREAHFRYGAVLVVLLALLVFAIAAPDAKWARTLDVVLAGGALLVAVATSRARRPIRRQRSRVVAAAALVVVLGTATGLFPAALTFAVVTLLLAAVPVSLVGGLLRLVREEGVNVHAVAGGLAIYLVAGLLFASVISFVAHVQSGPYFTHGAHVSGGERVYYSFTVLTTTGFGDYTAATGFGHALAVLEMLTGQLYLVTVIGVLIGNYTGRRR